ncbi:MAG TPA: hypothetical protein PK708_01690 [Candidatus Competibacter sp.]|nr:hypothetical protein [Candidatus Competibacter sp.]
MQQVKRLEVAVLGLMETNQDRHDLGERQPTGPSPPPAINQQVGGAKPAGTFGRTRQHRSNLPNSWWELSGWA